MTAQRVCANNTAVPVETQSTLTHCAYLLGLTEDYLELIHMATRQSKEGDLKPICTVLTVAMETLSAARCKLEKARL